ncbi:MAG: alpha/beta fold hydrolase, partial [Planctomycetaceae bacterium]
MIRPAFMSHHIVAVLMSFLTWNDISGGQPQRSPGIVANAGDLAAEIEHYTSRMDGVQRPYGIVATGDADRPRPLIVHLQPGLGEVIENPGRAFQKIETVVDVARKQGRECIAIRPTGRGPGSLFQNYGEVDALEAIEDVCSKYSVDRNRITLFGHSMGGAAVFYIVSHYPDRFAGAVPMSGYCDYRLWRKPGGYTFHMPPWEEPSWQSRSAALLVVNFQHTPTWMIHGAWDRGVGGGVSVEHSRNMQNQLMERGFRSRFTEVSGTGHGIRDDQLFQSAVEWMLDQTKETSPNHVRLSTSSLRHNKSYWVTIQQFQAYGRMASIDARISDPGSVAVSTVNVQALSLGPVARQSRSSLMIDRQRFADVDLTQAKTFRFKHATGTWEEGQPESAAGKHHRCSGPIGDLYFENVILVPGSTGTEEENFFTRMAAYNQRSLFRRTNGGLHRGGIPGENSVILPLTPDTELSDDVIRT